MTTSTHDSTSALLATYWGKADPAVAARGGAAHHTVLGHSLDVAACAFVLVERHPVLAAQFGRSLGLSGGAVPLTVAALCVLHDIGKFDTRFQRKAPAVADVLRPHTQEIVTGKYDHGSEGYRQIAHDSEVRARVQAALGPSALPLLQAVCGHHGSLPTRDEPDPNLLKGSIRVEDAEARRQFAATVVPFFSTLGATLPCRSGINGAFVQRLAGLCSVADWLGSNVEHFSYRPGPISELGAYWEESLRRAAEACEASGLLRAVATGASFHALFSNYQPRDVQKVTERVASDQPALVIVEAEMGKGKTEAALALASRFLREKLADGLTVALPTMATSNALFARVEAVTEHLFGPGGVQLALAHSRSRNQPRFEELVKRGLRARDKDAPEASVACARWLLNKKRILLAQVGVGTIDQALQAAIMVRHQFVRMFGLSRNVVVIDEVHAYDAYMEVLLEHLLTWLGALDVPVILLSATLPSVRRAALARAWRDGHRGVEDEPTEPLESLEDAKRRPYPLVSVTTSAGTMALSNDEPSPTRTIAIERVTKDDDDDVHARNVAGRLLAAARAGARVAWIRNTVGEAQRAFRAVTELATDDDVRLFHARFRGCDRREIESSVLREFGKTAPTGGRVLVATQVVEQSLDLDFDELHSDLAPIDLLFQRAGRLHRHTRPRPSGFATPRLVVHMPSDPATAALGFGPSRYVYDAGTLSIAARALRGRDELRLPADIRGLVEQTYHPESRRALVAECGAALVAAEEKRTYELEARRTHARRCCIPATTSDPEGLSSLDDDEESVQKFTRDGQSVTLLPFLWGEDGGRALDAEATASAWHLDAGREDAWRLAGELIDETLSLSARSQAEGEVGKSERPRWDAWRRRFETFADETSLGRRVAPIPMRRLDDGWEGRVRLDGRPKRVTYTPTLGLVLESEETERAR